MIDIDTKMADFARRAVASLPPVLARKPFEVQITEQRTELTPRKAVMNRFVSQGEPPQVLAPGTLAIFSVNPNSGPIDGGTAITITGENFVSGCKVYLGGSLANSIVVASSTLITCSTLPHAAGPVDVTVTLNDDPNFSATRTGGFTYIAPPPDSYFWESSGPALTPWGFNYGEIKALYIWAMRGGQHYTGYQGKVNVSTILIGPNVSFNDNPDIDYPINVVNGVAVLQIQAFYNEPGASATQSLQFRAKDATDANITGDTPIMGVINNGSGAVGRKTGGGGGGGVNHFGWNMGYSTAYGAHGAVVMNPWNWEGITLQVRQVEMSMLSASGLVDTSFNGIATIGHIYLTQPTSSNGFGVSGPGTATFVNGRATFNVSASYNGGSPYQSYAYFFITATAGSLSSQSPQCVILNHL